MLVGEFLERGKVAFGDEFGGLLAKAHFGFGPMEGKTERQFS